MSKQTRRGSVGSGTSSATPTPPSHSRNPTAGYAAGTVGALKPTPVVALDPSSTVLEAACYMASRRVDAVLLGSSNGVSGILTDKDLAFRVVAAGMDAQATPSQRVMTKDPVKVFATDTAQTALKAMIQGQFRHLPVVDAKENVVVGLLDVTKCLYDSLEKLEAVYANSRRDVLKAARSFNEGVQKDSNISSTTEAAMIQYAEILRHQLGGPNLASLLNPDSSPPVVGMRDTVTIACQRMHEANETAVLVFDSDAGAGEDGLGTLCGIFTSKDLVLRVLAASLDPSVTPVSRVMTPHPECVSPETPVLEALRKMHVGRYLHLPVIDSQGVIEGLVDVLKLTYSTLNQLSQIQPTDHDPAPVWDRFWTDTTSILSGDGQYHPSTHRRPPPPRKKASTQSMRDETATIFPHDSASVVAMESYHPIPAPAPPGSTLSSSHSFKEGTFGFKLRDFSQGRTHRFTAPIDSLLHLQHLVHAKLNLPDTPTPAQICYFDDEEDIIHLNTDADLLDAIQLANRLGWARIVIFSESQRGVYEHSLRTGGSEAGTAAGTSFSRRFSGIGMGSGGAGSSVTVGSRMVTVEEVEQMEAMVAPVLIGAGVAVICAFLLGRAFK
ncbi:hypothetical protein HDU98_001835 [Podochytrium sp. JEL0797]|nr:hypothetical protein HDU98_001835 [Podochytrium sp. JEL0797]